MASATTYTGPSAREMFESHTLSKEIIARADDAEPVLDASELALLKRYVTAPESKAEILEELGCIDGDGKVVTAKAQGDGSLVAYIMVSVSEFFAHFLVRTCLELYLRSRDFEISNLYLKDPH